MPRFLSLAVALILLALPALAGTKAEFRGTAGGPFALTTSKGESVTEKNFFGKYMLVFFGYTYCPDICPTELQTALDAIDIAGVNGKITPVFISIDPARDTPAKMAAYEEQFNNQIIGLTGSPEQVAKAARAYKVYYARSAETPGDDYMMDHSSFLYLMGPDGKFIRAFAGGSEAQAIADVLKQTIK